VAAFVSLVVPALAGLTGRPAPELATVRLARPVPGRGGYTHLAPIRRTATGDGEAVGHAGSSMLRGLAQAVGFAVIPPGTAAAAGDTVDLVPLPLLSGEVPVDADGVQ
jgi:molybdopterin molybdotransferase